MTGPERWLEVAEEVQALRAELALLSEAVTSHASLGDLPIDPLMAAAAAEQAALEEELEATRSELAALQQHHSALLDNLEAVYHPLDQHLRQTTEHWDQRRHAHAQQAQQSSEALRGARHHNEAEPGHLRQSQQSVHTAYQQLASDLQNHHHRSRQALQETRHQSEQHGRTLGHHTEAAVHGWHQDGSFLGNQVGDLEQRLSEGTGRLRERAEEVIQGQVQAAVAEGLHALETAVEESLHRLSHDTGELSMVRTALQPLVEELSHLFHPLKDHSDHVHHRASELGIH